MGAHWKIWFLGGDSRKANIWEGNCLKREGLDRQERGGVFWGGGGVHTPMHTMITPTATRYPAISDKFPE